MDQMPVGPENVAKIDCPACGETFYQKFSDHTPFKVRERDILTGCPVRTVELIHDCPFCGKRGISMAIIQTNLSWKGMVKESTQAAICNNVLCSRRRLLQEIMLGRTRLGAPNPL